MRRRQVHRHPGRRADHAKRRADQRVVPRRPQGTRPGAAEFWQRPWIEPPRALNVPRYHATSWVKGGRMPRSQRRTASLLAQGTPRVVTRIQTGVRIEKHILKVLKAIA